MIPCGLFRAAHSHNPTPIFAYRGAYAPLLCEYRGGSQGHSTTNVQAHVMSDLLTLVSIYSFSMEQRTLHPMLYYCGNCLFGWTTCNRNPVSHSGNLQNFKSVFYHSRFYVFLFGIDNTGSNEYTIFFEEITCNR